jgi:hypothetical protein
VTLDGVMSALRRIRDLAEHSAAETRRSGREDVAREFDHIQREAERALGDFP